MLQHRCRFSEAPRISAQSFADSDQHDQDDLLPVLETASLAPPEQSDASLEAGMPSEDGSGLCIDLHSAFVKRAISIARPPQSDSIASPARIVRGVMGQSGSFLSGDSGPIFANSLSDEGVCNRQLGLPTADSSRCQTEPAFCSAAQAGRIAAAHNYPTGCPQQRATLPASLEAPSQASWRSSFWAGPGRPPPDAHRTSSAAPSTALLQGSATEAASSSPSPDIPQALAYEVRERLRMGPSSFGASMAAASQHAPGFTSNAPISAAMAAYGRRTSSGRRDWELTTASGPYSGEHGDPGLTVPAVASIGPTSAGKKTASLGRPSSRPPVAATGCVGAAFTHADTREQAVRLTSAEVLELSDASSPSPHVLFGNLMEGSQGRSQGLEALASTAPALDQPPASPSADSDAEGDPMTAAARMEALDAAIDMLQDGMGSDIRHQGADHNVIGAAIEFLSICTD